VGTLWSVVSSRSGYVSELTEKRAIVSKEKNVVETRTVLLVSLNSRWHRLSRIFAMPFLFLSII